MNPSRAYSRSAPAFDTSVSNTICGYRVQICAARKLKRLTSCAPCAVIRAIAFSTSVEAAAITLSSSSLRGRNQPTYSVLAVLRLCRQHGDIASIELVLMPFLFAHNHPNGLVAVLCLRIMSAFVHAISAASAQASIDAACKNWDTSVCPETPQV